MIFLIQIESGRLSVNSVEAGGRIRGRLPVGNKTTLLTSVKSVSSVDKIHDPQMTQISQMEAENGAFSPWRRYL
jgi:hypothetical protein